MKEDNIEICTRNCASMHSLLCMRRKAVKFEETGSQYRPYF